MANFASNFVSPIINCNEVLGSSSCLLVGKIKNCNDEPYLYTLEVTTAGAITDTQLAVEIATVNKGNAGTAAATASDSIVIREGAILYFGGTFIPVVVTEELVMTGTATFTLEIEALTVAIPLAATALTWGLELVDTVTDLPVNVESSEADRKDLKSGIQGSNVKTRIDLNIPVTYFASPLDTAQASILLPASTGTEDIYFVAAKSSGLVAFGKAKVMGLSESGDDQLTTYTTTLAAQSPFAVAQRSASTRINSSAAAASLRTLMRYSSLPVTF